MAKTKLGKNWGGGYPKSGIKRETNKNLCNFSDNYIFFPVNVLQEMQIYF